MTVHQFEDNAAKGAQGYAINWDTAEARVKDLKAYLMNAPQVMDPERLQFLNEVYEEYILRGHPFSEAQARCLPRPEIVPCRFLSEANQIGAFASYQKAFLEK